MGGAVVVAVEQRRERMGVNRLLAAAGGKIVVLAQWRRGFLYRPRRQGVGLVEKEEEPFGCAGECSIG